MVTKKRIIIRPKNTSDAWDDYSWETDPELAELDAAPVIRMPYTQYLLDYDVEVRRISPTSRQFSVDTLDGEHIGNCSYYNLDESKCEVELGIMIGNRDYWNRGYGTETVITLVNHIFGDLKVNRIHLKTLESNRRAQKCFQKCGFIVCGQLDKFAYQFLRMEIYRDQWHEQLTETEE
ncbi:MAG: GNAT family N-acetyltransferase [Dehalococcoidales bacterium]